YHLASQFGLRVTDTRPGLVPLMYEPGIMERIAPLSGGSTDVIATANKKSFAEALLFTHRGLSGPAILQISSYWREGDAISIDLMPNASAMDFLRAARPATPKLQVQTIIANILPKRLAQLLGDELDMHTMIGDFPD